MIGLNNMIELEKVVEVIVEVDLVMMVIGFNILLRIVELIV